MLKNIFILIAAFLALLAWYLSRHNASLQEKLSYREACLSGKYTNLKDLHAFVTDTIETVEGEMERDEFLETYYWKARPVLMKGAGKHWPAYSQWSDQHLQTTFHDMKFYVDMRKDHTTHHAVRRKMTLGKFINNYKTRDWYLDSMTIDKRFLDETHVPRYLNVSGIFKPDNNTHVDFYHNLYLSSGNTSSALHYDGYDNFMTLLDGTKDWIIAEPEDALKLRLDEWLDHPNLSPLNVTNFNVSEHPQLCDVKFKRAVLAPGDTLFVPILYAHHVYSPPSRNMAIGMWFFLPAYSSLLDEAGFDEIDTRNISGLVDVYLDHVSKRPAPCTVTDCSFLPPGTLRTVLPDNIEVQYSRDSDVPPSATVQMKVFDNKTVSIPVLGYGTGLPGGSIANPYLNTKLALNMGYKLVDTAQMYGNEKEVGEAVRHCKWLRKSVVVLTKIVLSELPAVDLYSAVSAKVEQSLLQLDVEYIDILLIHDTVDNTAQQLTVGWIALEAAVKSGKVRAIGLSNADISRLQQILSIATVPVSLVQNMFNPLEYDKEVFNFCRENGIVFMGYGLTGDVYALEFNIDNPVLSHHLLSNLSEQYDASKHSVLYNWAAQKGVVLTARSTRLQHMTENMHFQDIFLNKEHMDQLDQLFIAEEEIAAFLDALENGAV